MKKKVFVLFIAAMAITALLSSGFIQQSANQLYQSGIYKEDVEGKLEEAIAIYQEIIKKFSQEGPVAAKAWFHIGLCYEKLGQEKVKQAQEAFQKVLDTYPGETDVVKVAREKLTILLKAQSATRDGGRKVESHRVLSIRGTYEWHQVSPDGRYIAYIDYGGMETGVVVFELATGITRRLKCKVDEREGTGTSWSFVWSPNGKSIVCSWWREDPSKWADLRLLFLDDSAPKRIFQGDYYEVLPCSWSSDGRYILAAFYKGKNRTGTRMGIISTEDGLVRFLETPVGGQLWPGGFSPDGRYVTYNSSHEPDPDKNDIFLLSVDEKTRVSLVTHPANDAFLGWSPDGTHVLFTSDRLGTADVWAVAVADGRPAKEAEVIRRGIGQMQFAGITRSGSLYFTTSNVSEDIYILKIEQESGKRVAPPEKMILSEEGSNSVPQYSPDGRFLAYLRESLNPGATLCVLSLETREERRFPLGTPARLPRWSPDGRSVYFTSILPGPRFRMFRMDLETGRHSAAAPERPDDLNLANLFIGCSPDGKSIYYMSKEKEEDKEVCRILARNTENGVEQELFQAVCEFAWRSTSISPDGTRLATVSREAQRAITILPTSGNGASKVLYRFEQWVGSAVWLAWTPDGRSIIFAKNDGSGSSLWRISADGGDPQNLGITTTNPVSGICVHPDGKRLAFSTSVAFDNWETELWVMENFLPPGK